MLRPTPGECVAFWTGERVVRRHLVVLLLLTPLSVPDVFADVIGRMTPAEALTSARVATLPERDRAPWLEYLERSRQRMAADKGALTAERVGLANVPDSPPTGSWASKALEADAAWYGSAEARRIADNIVSFQTPTGGWGKNQDRTGPTRVRGQQLAVNERLPANARSGIPGDDDWAYVGTIDNDATIVELRFLAKVQQTLPGADGDPYRAAALKGLRYLLEAQYPNGGWPQVYPLAGGYHDAMTFNDNALANVAEFLTAVATRQDECAFVPTDVAADAGRAVSRALEVVTQAQVVVGATRTGWGQQHDPLTLRPVGARNYEPAALSSTESAAMLSFLMRVPTPSPAVVRAVHAGVAWLKTRGLRDIEWRQGASPGDGRRAMPKPGAGPLWARIYDITTMRPIFGDRDRTIHDDVNDISLERRNGYAWYSTAPAKTIRQYEAWAVRH
ncbi:MAG TPA: pectate lyase [Luteitalea sp.]|nr:pectate lyase [Luteitalea sp.]